MNTRPSALLRVSFLAVLSLGWIPPSPSLLAQQNDPVSREETASQNPPQANSEITIDSDDDSEQTSAPETLEPSLADRIRTAFQQSHDGWSVDEVLLDDERRHGFLLAMAKNATTSSTDAEKRTWLEGLLKLRKSGKLQIRATQRSKVDVSDERAAAEIASRWMVDQHDATTDQWLIEPTLLSEYDRFALNIQPDSTPYRLRKAALQLRKARRLRPELTTRVTDWKRNIEIMTIDQARQNAKRLPTQAGVYIFRDPTGYLYIGQSNNLRNRLTKHLEDSDRKSLSRYLEEKSGAEVTLELHVFGSQSPATDTTVREAYESELIRTRKPRFNVAP